MLFVFVYPIIFNRGFYRILALLITLVCFFGTNILTSLMFSAFPSEYDNTAKYIYDPILREYVGQNVLDQSKSSYINSNSEILIGELRELSKEYDSETLRRIAVQIGAITSQKDSLKDVLGRLHFNRNKRTIILNLEMIDILASINIQVGRLVSMPADYAGRLDDLKRRHTEVSRALQSQTEKLQQYLVLREQYKKEYDEIQQKAKIAPDQVDHLQARKLVANIKSLMDAVDKETGQLATIKNNVNQVKSELDALGAYGERMRIDTNAIEEINNLLSALNYKIAKSSEYTKEDSKIIRLHNSLWFVP
jgi:hypothetical protein